MKISLAWIADFVDLDGVTPERVAELLSLHTAEVEGIEYPGAAIADVVVGVVKECGRHPGADKLSVTKVAFGGPEVVDVVCGAPNVRAGLKIAFAPVGATLPGGLKIKQAKLRGAPSVGMICSERELELSEEHDGILELPDDAPVGALLVDYLGLRDAVLELDNKSLTHRPDLWGHYGFARELSAILRRPLRALDADFTWPTPASNWRIQLQDADCPLYLGVSIRLPGGPRPSPRAIRARLLAVGARPRNDAVDLTNYVLFETGQPLHAFDAAHLRGGKVVVRAARAGEELHTLDDEHRQLDGSELVIADAERAVALAGVIGGEESAVSTGSEDLLLEAAAFRAARVRRTAQRFALRTDASSRFEKALDPLGVEVAARRYCTLLRRLRPDAIFASAPARAGVAQAPALRVRFAPAACAQGLGVDPGESEMRGILERLGFGVEGQDSGAWQVSVPSWRATKDVSIQADLIEEVGRLHGYDRITPAPLSAPVVPPRERPMRRLERRLITRLIGAHQAHETQAYAFLERRWLERLRGNAAQHLRMLNPVQADADLIRRDPMAALLQQAHDNTRERANGRIFESARGYEPQSGTEPRERCWLGLVAWQRRPLPDQGPQSIFAQVRAVAEDLLRQAGINTELASTAGSSSELTPWLHPAHSLAWTQGGALLGWSGRVDPRVAAELDGERVAFGALLLDLAALAEAAARSPGVRFRSPARMPAVKVDVALAMPSTVSFQTLETALREAGGRLLERLELFDLYEGGTLAPGQRSLAFHAVLRAVDRTLEDRDEQGFLARVKAIAEALGGQLRA